MRSSTDHGGDLVERVEDDEAETNESAAAASGTSTADYIGLTSYRGRLFAH